MSDVVFSLDGIFRKHKSVFCLLSFPVLSVIKYKKKWYNY